MQKIVQTDQKFGSVQYVLYVQKLELGLLQNQTDWEQIWFGSRVAQTDVN